MQTRADYTGNHLDDDPIVRIAPLYTAADSTPNLLPAIGANPLPAPVSQHINPVPAPISLPAATAASLRPGPATATLLRLRAGPRPPNAGQVRILKLILLYRPQMELR